MLPSGNVLYILFGDPYSETQKSLERAVQTSVKDSSIFQEKICKTSKRTLENNQHHDDKGAQRMVPKIPSFDSLTEH